MNPAENIKSIMKEYQEYKNPKHSKNLTEQGKQKRNLWKYTIKEFL